MDLVRSEEFSTAGAFLDALAPRDARWAPDPTRWLFRGHADDKWALIPNALRPDVELEPGRRGPLAKHWQQVNAEFDHLENLVAEANSQGLTLPAAAEAFWANYDRVKRDFYESANNFPGKAWPWPALTPLLALAQHYRIPTRLLDWSGEARVAAYFAASEAAAWAKGTKAPARENVERLEVWAVRRRAVERIAQHAAGAQHHAGPAIEFRSAPGATNPNLHAQRGAFSVVLDRSGGHCQYSAGPSAA